MSSHVGLAKHFLRILGSGSLSPLRELFSEDIRFEYPGISAITGKSRVVLLLKKILSRFETLQFEAIDFIQENEKLCVIWKNAGRLKTGEAFHNEGISILHVRDGMISYVSDYFKQDWAEERQ